MDESYLKENRLYKLRSDPDIEEVAEKVFFVKHNREVMRTDPETELPVKVWKSYTVKEVMTKWGVQNHYDNMVRILKNKIKEHPEEDIVVHYDYGDFKAEPEHQKLLGWAIWNAKRKEYGLVGGILFQNGEMSFHT